MLKIILLLVVLGYPQITTRALYDPVPDVFNVNTGTLTTTTAYTSHVEQTDSEPCVSADGSDICKLYAAGQLVCASNAYPLGSTLYVDGYGECVVADRMNKRYNKRVDVYFGYDRARALNWGKRNVLVLKIN